MRSQKSRSRGKNRNNNNNNRSGVNVVNRVFDSSGPEGKVRGTPQQIIEKYQQLHRDAQLSGDRVAAENFQQHAEHYARMLGEAMREQEAKREQHEAQQAQQRREREERDAQRGNDQQDRAERRDDRQENTKPARQERPASGEDNRSGLERTLGASVAGSGDQPDVIDLGAGGEESDSGLVETVEAAPKPARKPRTRKPKAAVEAPAEPSAETPSDDQTAAE